MSEKELSDFIDILDNIYINYHLLEIAVDKDTQHKPYLKEKAANIKNLAEQLERICNNE